MLGNAAHVIATAVPTGKRGLHQQVEESLGAIKTALTEAGSAALLAQTVFLQDMKDAAACRRLFASYYGPNLPVTTFVHQPPCNGAALALEAWAVGGDSVEVRRYGPHLVLVSHNGVTWAHCGGIVPATRARSVYQRALNAFAGMRAQVDGWEAGFGHVVRTWLYIGDIVGPEKALDPETHTVKETQRYKELNRARTDFYRGIPFGRGHLKDRSRRQIYPASTGIGMNGSDLAMSCLALDTQRKDVFILPLENPQQTPAYQYHSRFSPQSPKFSRAMAVVVGDDVITLVSGTASIVDSETRYIGNVKKQTEQTLENIERLIAPENYAAHKIPCAGATMDDLIFARVYVKRPEDYPKCRDVCRKRLGAVPITYVVADVCRPELLVEIECIAASKRRRNPGL